VNDRLGLAFFAFAAVIAARLAWDHSTLLAWLAAAHNALLVVIYARRRSASAYDPKGLLLGLCAAFLPTAIPYPQTVAWQSGAVAILGYILVLWSLLTLGDRFGIAPADRGLVTDGPYRLVRHPMYLGELLIRGALVVNAPQPALASLALAILITLQIARSLREERIIAGYSVYSRQVRFRLFPGIW
jgi:protein-S-isoprenylcysteine O-methyltransferase Ste14